ncbi:MAG: four helix bundle protein [Calditrichia bacterium]
MENTLYLRLGHKNLKVWEEAMDLTEFIFVLTVSFPKRETYGLAAHLRKTCTSVVSNISEGASRKSSKERRRFFEISRSSLVELDTQLEISRRAGFIDSELDGEIRTRLYRSFMMLTRLMNSTRG